MRRVNALTGRRLAANERRRYIVSVRPREYTRRQRMSCAREERINTAAGMQRLCEPMRIDARSVSFECVF